MTDEQPFPDSFEEEPQQETPSPSTPNREDTDHLWESAPEEAAEEEEDVTEAGHTGENHLTLPKDIPFPIVVEVGRMKMSLEKLLQLQPGNILETNVRPEQGVYLTVHGKHIAKGELVKVGDVLGVKIIHLQESDPSCP